MELPLLAYNLKRGLLPTLRPALVLKIGELVPNVEDLNIYMLVCVVLRSRMYSLIASLYIIESSVLA